MNNWHSIALTGSSLPALGLPGDWISSAPPHRLHSEVIVVLASLTLLSVQPRRASKEKTKQDLAHFTPRFSDRVLRAWRPLPTDPHTWKMASGCLGIRIPAVFCLCLEAKRRTRILWCSMKVRSPWAWSAGAGRAHRRTEHYIILFILYWIKYFFLFTSYCNFFNSYCW